MGKLKPLDANYIDEYVGKFLLTNGFKKTADKRYTNVHCNVIIHNNCFEIWDKELGGSIFSNNHVLYWLVGILVWNDWIPRNFEIA